MRYHEEEHQHDEILKEIFTFCISTDFCERTGMSAMDLMNTDPSTFYLIKQTYDKIKEPEIKKQESLLKETENLRRMQMNNLLQQQANHEAQIKQRKKK